MRPPDGFDDQYGTTPLDPDDREALVPGVTASTKAELDELEAQSLVRVWEQRAEALLEARIDLEDLTRPMALIELHRDALANIWKWAGRIRTREMNIGSPPERIREELYEAMDTVRYWADSTDMDAFEVAVRAHHVLVRVHPFVDVNGRISRIYADLVMLALTGDQVLDWTGARDDKPTYINALREADASGDVSPLRSTLGRRALDIP